MNFKIKRENLIYIFSEFVNILKENAIRPSIAGLKIEAYDNKVVFTGTNLDVAYIKTEECEVIENGTSIFKPNLALEYIKLLDDEFIELSTNDKSLSIHLAEFLLLPDNSFPENIKVAPLDEIATINSKILYTNLKKVEFSASKSVENININCIRVLFKPNNIEFVSTDSYRLTYNIIEATSKKEAAISLPLESTNILLSLIKDTDISINIFQNSNILIFMWENTYFSMELTTLPFPNFENILANNSFSKEIEFNYTDFKSSLKKTITIAKTNYESKNAAIFNFKGKKLSISATSGRAKITQNIDMIKNGDDFKCSLNVKFLYEFLENIEKNIFIKGNTSSSMFEITEQSNTTYKYILMPLALRD